jgi:hypothetical protein
MFNLCPLQTFFMIEMIHDELWKIVTLVQYILQHISSIPIQIIVDAMHKLVFNNGDVFTIKNLILVNYNRVGSLWKQVWLEFSHVLSWKPSIVHFVVHIWKSMCSIITSIFIFEALSNHGGFNKRKLVAWFVFFNIDGMFL